MERTIETINARLQHNAELEAGIKRHMLLRQDNEILRRGLESFQAVIRELTELKNEIMENTK